MRRNPTTTTPSDARRETRASVLAKRQRGVVSIDVVSDGMLARVRYGMRNGDVIEQLAPSLFAAVRGVGDLRMDRPIVPQMSINGMAWKPSVVLKEVRAAYRVSESTFLSYNREAVVAWRDLGEPRTYLVGVALDLALRGEYRSVDVIRGVVSRAEPAVMMAAFAAALQQRIVSIGNPFDDWTSDADALMVDNGSGSKPTVIRDFDEYAWISLNGFNRRYADEGIGPA